MKIQELTSSEQLLLLSVGLGTVVLTGGIILCIIWRRCWIHKFIWKDVKKKGTNDVICIRYPPDMYPASVGIYREQIIRSPEDELARIFSSPVKRDSTYSSMSENSASVYELANSPIHGAGGSATSSPVTGTPESPDSTKHLLLKEQSRTTASSTSRGISPNPHNESKLSENELHLVYDNSKQPFFTFGLKYDDDNDLVKIDFLESRNMPLREYLNQGCDVFFILEIEPRKTTTSSPSILTPRRNSNTALRYRFVTKTVRRVSDIYEFTEKFLAQLPKSNLKEYQIRFTAFDQDRFGNPTELGSTTLTFEDFRDFTEHKLILSCSLKDPIIKRGEILVGLCFLPTAERLSVNIMKVANINPHYNTHGTLTQQKVCFVRVFLLRFDSGKVIKRKKTTYQKLPGNSSSSDPSIFNETVVFDMPSNELLNSVLLVMVCVTDKIIASSPTGAGTSNSTNIKRHSTPEQPSTSLLKLLSVSSGFSDSHKQRHSIDEALFHYSSNNLNHELLGTSKNIAESLSADSSRRSSMFDPSSEHSTSTLSKSKDQVVGKVAFSYHTRNSKTKAQWEKMIRVPRTIASEWQNLM